MSNFWFLVVSISVALLKISSVVDAKCECSEDEPCWENANCASTGISNCGKCQCTVGYRRKGLNKECEPLPTPKQKAGRSSTTYSTIPPGGPVGGSGGAPTTAATLPPVQTQATQPTPAPAPTTMATTLGAPPGPVPLVCSDYSCQPKVTDSDSGCKRKGNVPARPCKLGGGASCYGACVTDQGNDYCICDYYRVDRTCAVDKPGSCESATGQVPSSLPAHQNKRFVNKNNPNTAYARHFAPSISDCIKACQWASTQCFSVNYGPLGGQQICELLSIKVKGTTMDSPQWIVDAQGWTYQQIAP